MTTSMRQWSPTPTRPARGPGILVLQVVGTVVAVVLVAAASLSVVARFFHQERTETAVYSQPVTRMVVGTSTGSITVRAGAPSSPVVVRRTLGWSFGSAESQEHVSGGVLDVRGRCTGQFGFGLCSVSYEITAPAGTELALSSDTGSVLVDGPSGNVTASTSTGSVEVQNARSARVDASTSTGAVEVTFAAAPAQVRAESSTGAVEVVVPADGTAYDVVATTSTGSRDVSVPLNSASTHRIEARASTGAVEVRTAP